MSGPTFSVLIAAYNQAGYVAETLDSVAAQTCTDYELVAVNDGSTDGTETVVSDWIRRFGRAHPNRAVLSTTANGGQSAALEHGFALCSGRYVALLDSDDRWLPHKLAEVLRVVSEHPDAGMVVHPLFVIDQEGRRTGDVRPMRAKLSEGDLRGQITRTTRHVAPATSGVVIRADVFRRLLPMATRPFRDAADAYLTLGASLLAPVRAVQEPLAEYRMHPDGNYLKRFATAEGLRYTVELERTIVRHFGLEAAAERNTYFARNEFALQKLAGGPAARFRAYRRLVRATLGDPTFRPRDRVLLLGFWTTCLLAPARLFARLWGAFQRRHTGIDRIVRARRSASGTAPGAAVPLPGSGA
ncbi:MAG TPA: glycosyltransferase [Longimicrobiaceae bacterium]|nr:glycosyltransferase [Longimicrobiaceae bacterium]